MIQLKQTFLTVILLFNYMTCQSSVPIGLIPAKMDLNGGWSSLFFNITQSPWVTNKFLVTAPLPLNLLFSDAFCPGKMVSIYINGSFSVNSTTVPLNSNCSPRIDLPSGTFAFPDVFSHANLTLPVGVHEIAIKVIQSDPTLPTGIMYMRSYTSLSSICN